MAKLVSRIIGHCSHCKKITNMDRKDSWEVKWDLWSSELRRLEHSATLCNDCCIKFMAFMNRL